MDFGHCAGVETTFFHPSDKDPSLGTPSHHPSDKDPSLGTPSHHPSDEDLSLGTPAHHPSDEDLSPGTPAHHPSDEDLSPGTPRPRGPRLSLRLEPRLKRLRRSSDSQAELEKNVLQGLKPGVFVGLIGTAEAVPFQNSGSALRG